MILSSRLAALNDLVGTPSSDSEEAGSGTTLPAVHGPGVTVTLDDSPLWETAVDSSGSATNINDYVVHQQDIEAVVNALWAGGAESMMIQDQRVLFSSAVICSGNVLLLQGKQYSPPYTVSAIGPVDKIAGGAGRVGGGADLPRIRRRVRVGLEGGDEGRLQFDEAAALLQPLQYATATETEGVEQ